MSVGQNRLTVVAGEHVIEIRVDRSSGPRSMIVSTELDYGPPWILEEPGWQDVAVGVSNGVAYWWSARHLVILPTDQFQGKPVIIAADEDIRLVFDVADGWLVVCETSVQLFAASQLLSRIDLGEIILGARWEGPRLIVQDTNGHDIMITAQDGCLTISP